MTYETAKAQAQRLVSEYGASYAREVGLGLGQFGVLFKLGCDPELTLTTVDHIERYLNGEPVRAWRA